MKKHLAKIPFLLVAIQSSVFAEDTSPNILGIDNEKLRTGNVSFSDIPKSIQSATTFILGLAATIAMIMIIVGGLKYSLGTMEGSAPNKSKAQETIKYGIMGFVVAVSSWFVIKLVIENF